MKDNSAKIDAYIRGDLPEEEMNSFREKIAADNDLALQVRLQQLEWEAAHILREDDLRNKFQAWGKEKKEVPLVPIKKETPSKGAKRRSLFSRMAAAASILLIIGVGGLFLQAQQFTNEALFKEFYEEPIYSSNLKSPGTSINDLTIGAKLLFEDKNYSQAIQQLQGVAESSPNYVEAQLLIGHAFFEKGNANKSTSDLQEAVRFYQKVLSASTDYEMKSKAEWFTLLAQLSMNQVDESFYNRLKTISTDNDHDFRNDAKKLLSKINSRWYQWAN